MTRRNESERQRAPAGKKRPRVKGCYQCSRRRIDCDRQEPTCQKCLLKGLECSGLGLRYRFNDGLAARGKMVGQVVPSSLSYRKSASPMCRIIQVAEQESSEELTSQEQDRALQLSDKHTSSLTAQWDDEVDISKHIAPIQPHIERPLDHLDGESRFLLKYFSEQIAPQTAVIIIGFNGYRDLILPFSETEPLVRDAVILVARQHLSLRFGFGDATDIHAYDGLIQGLITRSRHSTPHESITSMTVLLLLHIREVISGSEDFKLIYGSLRALANSTLQTFRKSSCELSNFVHIQILRARLFGEALFDETFGLQFLSTNIWTCLEFLRFCRSLHPELADLVGDIFTLVTVACEVYVKRAGLNPPSHQTRHLIDKFQKVAERVSARRDVVGQHLLAWPYFVMAAESTSQEHRMYFQHKLQSLFDDTLCQGILRGLRKIETIWEAGSETRWTSLLGGPDQFFIM